MRDCTCLTEELLGLQLIRELQGICTCVWGVGGDRMCAGDDCCQELLLAKGGVTGSKDRHLWVG